MGLALSDQEKVLYDEAMRAEYRRRFLFYKPHHKQKLFHDAGLLAKERLFLAGNRTGKTLAASLEVCMHITGNYPDWWQGYRYDKPVNVWILGQSSQVVRDTLQKQYYLGDPEKGTLGLIHPSLIVEIKKARGIPDAIDTFYAKHSSGGISKVSFKTAEQGREKLQGDKVDIVHIDEEVKMSIYSECLIRTTATEKGFHGMIIVSMTPLKGQTELIVHFTEDRQAETVRNSRWHVIATWDDNPHLSEEEKGRLKEGMSEYELNARVNGIPWRGSGMIYPYLDKDIMCSPFEIPDYWPRCYGLDFGRVHPTAALFLAHDRDNDVVYAYAEYCVAELDADQHAAALLRMNAKWIPGVYDPSGDNREKIKGDKIAQVYMENGLVNLTPANNAVEPGIDKCRIRYRTGRLKIFNTLTKTLNERRDYYRDEDGKVKKIKDDLMDAKRYGVVSGLAIAVPENYQDPSYRGRYGRSKQSSYI